MSQTYQITVNILSSAPHFTASSILVNNINCGAIVNNNPFGNCQSWSISNCVSLMDYTRHADFKDIIQEVKKVAGISKALLVIDLNESAYQKIKTKLNFISTKSYKSSNGSRMRICVVDTRIPQRVPTTGTAVFRGTLTTNNIL